MKLFLRKILVLCVILMIAAVALDHMFTGIFRGGRTVKAQWLNQIHGEHYDLVITGSSRAWWNIDMHLIQERCGMRGINLATNHFRSAEILLGLKIFLANGNTTDQLLLQLDYQKASDADEVFSATVYDHLPWLEEDLVYEHLRSRSSEFELLRKVPFARYGRYNFHWGPEEALITLLDKRRTLFDSTGSFFIDREFHGYPVLKIDSVRVEWDADLAEVFELCGKNGIEMDVFMAPYYRLQIPPGTEQRFLELMKKYEVNYLDHSRRLDDTVYFEDNWHLGRQGGVVYTNILIDEVICPADPAAAERR